MEQPQQFNTGSENPQAITDLFNSLKAPSEPIVQAPIVPDTLDDLIGRISQAPQAPQAPQEPLWKRIAKGIVGDWEAPAPKASDYINPAAEDLNRALNQENIGPGVELIREAIQPAIKPSPAPALPVIPQEDINLKPGDPGWEKYYVQTGEKWDPFTKRTNPTYDYAKTDLGAAKYRADNNIGTPATEIGNILQAGAERAGDIFTGTTRPEAAYAQPTTELGKTIANALSIIGYISPYGAEAGAKGLFGIASEAARPVEQIAENLSARVLKAISERGVQVAPKVAEKLPEVVGAATRGAGMFGGAGVVQHGTKALAGQETPAEAFQNVAKEAAFGAIVGPVSKVMAPVTEAAIPGKGALAGALRGAAREATAFTTGTAITELPGTLLGHETWQDYLKGLYQSAIMGGIFGAIGGEEKKVAGEQKAEQRKPYEYQESKPEDIKDYEKFLNDRIGNVKTEWKSRKQAYRDTVKQYGADSPEAQQAKSDFDEWTANIRKASNDYYAYTAEKRQAAGPLKALPAPAGQVSPAKMPSVVPSAPIERVSEGVSPGGKAITPGAQVTPQENAPGAAPAQAKEPWQMTRDEYRKQENQTKYDAIVEGIKAGKPIRLATQYRITPLTSSDHIRLANSGVVQIVEGRGRWVNLFDEQVNSLAQQAGMKIPDFSERVYHSDIIQEALDAGKPVPLEVLKEYPDLSQKLTVPKTEVPKPPKEQEKKPAPTAVKYGKTGNATFTKWGKNERVNADLSNPNDPYVQAYRKFFEFYYDRGVTGNAPKYNEVPDLGEYNYPPFLQNVFYKAGQIDAARKVPQEMAPEVNRTAEIAKYMQGQGIPESEQELILKNVARFYDAADQTGLNVDLSIKLSKRITDSLTSILLKQHGFEPGTDAYIAGKTEISKDGKLLKAAIELLGNSDKPVSQEVMHEFAEVWSMIWKTANPDDYKKAVDYLVEKGLERDRAEEHLPEIIADYAMFGAADFKGEGKTMPRGFFGRLAAMFKEWVASVLKRLKYFKEKVLPKLSPEVKSQAEAFSRGDWETAFRSIMDKQIAPETRYAVKQGYAPTFYSQLEKAIEEKLPNRASAAQVMAVVRAGGVKADELKWVGLEDWLKKQGGPVNKQDVLQFIKDNDLQIKEVTIAEPNIEIPHILKTTEWEKYLDKEYTEDRPEELAGMKEQFVDDNGDLILINEVDDDYRNELLNNYGNLFNDDFYDLIFPERSREVETKFEEYTLPGGENYREMLFVLPAEEKLFTSGHWDEPNVLAHTRLTDRDDTDDPSNRVLFIEEIQSDWHQKGREKGYAFDIKAIKDKLVKEYDLPSDTGEWSLNILKQAGVPQDLQEQWYGSAMRGKVPPAPFAKTWHEFVLKRLLRYAAENDYDKIGWTTGEQQNERYDLSEKVEQVRVVTNFGGSYYDVYATPVETGEEVVAGQSVNREQLSGIIGKELAAKVPTGSGSIQPDTIFEGPDLKIGGSGMHGFYDKIIPDFLNSYGKKWGAQVEEATIPTENMEEGGRYYAYEKVHSLPVTDAMRKSVLYEGQRKFSVKSDTFDAILDTYKKWAGEKVAPKEELPAPEKKNIIEPETATKEAITYGAGQRNEGTPEPSRGAGTEAGGPGALEGVPPENVPGTGAVGQVGRGPGQVSGANAPGEHADHPATAGQGKAGEGLPEKGPAAEKHPAAGVGTGKREVPVSTRGAGQAESLTKDTRNLPGHNYDMKNDPEIGKGNQKQKLKNNIQAIRLLKDLQASVRLATPAEQAVLAKYAGWGGIPHVFKYGLREGDEWYPEQKELKSLLTPEEYRAAENSTMNAHYTSPMVVQAMWRAMEHLGFKGGRILEPGCGIGYFFGFMPDDIAVKSRLTGIDLEPITSSIAKQLFQKADIRNQGYEQSKLANDFYDIAISNVPFANVTISSDKEFAKYHYQLHNYYFAKTMQKVRPGGIIMFITGSGTMRAGRDAAMLRKMLTKEADLIGAVELPSITHKETALTEVTTDLIILRKRLPGEPPSGEDWQEIVDSPVDDGYGRPFPENEYFRRHPEMRLGELVPDKLHKDRAGVMYKGDNLTKDLQNALGKLPVNIYNERPTRVLEAPRDLMPAPEGVQDGTLILKDGKLFKIANEKLEPVLVSPAQFTRIKSLLGIRNATRQLLQDQLNPEAPDQSLEKQRTELNKLYDAHVKKYGALTAPKMNQIIDIDPDWPLLAALENHNKETGQYEKAAIFTTRTLKPVTYATGAENAHEALMISLNERGRIDWDRMAELTGKTTEVLQNDPLLKDILYINPSGNQWETSDSYLSGNVREKLVQAELAVLTDPAFQKNVDALKAIQPKDLAPDEIDTGLGAPWIPTDDIEDFIKDLLRQPYAGIRVQHAVNSALWRLDYNKHSSIATSVANYSTWGTNKVAALELIELALAQKTPEVRWVDDEGKSHVDVNATVAARSKQNEIKDEFKKWLWKDTSRADRLARIYNDTYNNTVLREYDGSHLTVPGLSADIELRPHQKNGIWRIIQGTNTLLGHEVGAGKTWTMQAAAMEMRRMGLVNKPMHVVMNHMLNQYVQDFRKAYPTAKLLVITNKDLPASTLKRGKNEPEQAFESKRRLHQNARKILFNKIVTNDWDSVICTYNTFYKIPVSAGFQRQFIQEQIDEIENAILELKEEQGGNRSDTRLVKQLAANRKRLEERMRELTDALDKDAVTPFEQLGIDQIFVDEADNFKNLYFMTKMSRIAGLPNSDAKRSMDLYMKVRYLTNVNNGRGVVFATGTPISNTMAEMFTMMRYLVPSELANRGLAAFDAWAANFGQAVTGVEMAPDGSRYRLNTRFAKFINAPELLKLFRSFSDVKRQAELKLDRPELEGGAPRIIAAEATQELKDYLEILAVRSDSIAAGIDPRVDNMLNVTNDGRKAALDMRLIDPKLPDNPDSKVNQMVNNVYELWKDPDNTKIKGVQLIFANLGVPRAPSDKEVITEGGNGPDDNIPESAENLTIYADIRQKLIKKGIPVAEIVYIHDAKNDVQKQTLYDKVNAGKIRVLLGSIGKMGAGTNVQERVTDGHFLDPPWRPRDIEQAEGRYVRPGNINASVRTWRYVTKGSFDVYMWQTIEAKAKFIAQALSGDISSRTMEDVDPMVMNAGIAKALATGNPRVLDKVKIDNDVNMLQAEANEFARNLWGMQNKIKFMPDRIAVIKSEIEGFKNDIASRKDTRGDKFRMVVVDLNKKDIEYTERAKAQAALLQFINHFTVPAGKIYRVGSVAGFKLGLEHPQRLMVIGTTNNYSVDPMIASIETTIQRSPEAILENNENKFVEYKKQLADLREEVKNPWPKQAELGKALEEQRKINDELGITSLTSPQMVEPDEIERQRSGIPQVVEEMGAEVDKAIDEITPPIGFSVKFTKKPKGAAKEGQFTFDDEDVEARWKASQGLKPEAISEKLKTWWQEFKNKATREFEHLPKTAQFAELRESLRQLSHQKDVQGDKTLRLQQGLVVSMSPEEYDLFTRKVILDDLQHELESGHELPFGFTEESLKHEKGRVDSLSSSNPTIQKAVQNRKRIWEAVKNDYIHAMKVVGFNVEDRLTKEDYYRHQILEYARNKGISGAGRKLETPTRRGFLKQRGGSESDINTDYVQAEYEVMAQMLFDTEVAKVIAKVDKYYNIRKSLEDQAKEANKKAIDKIIATEIEADRERLKREGKTDEEPVSATGKQLKGFQKKMAIAFSRLRGLAKDGDLWDGEKHEFADVVKSLEGPQDEDVDESSRLFRYLAELANQGDEVDGVISARTMFKAIGDRRAFIKETLGDKFMTWRRMVPDGISIWQPREGSHFYLANSIPEHIADQLLTGTLEEIGVSKDDIQRVFAKGQRFREFAIPDEVALTLDNLKPALMDNVVTRAARWFTRPMKIFFLTAPMKIIKYNLRNISGDTEAVWVGNPHAFKKVPQATHELYQVLIGNRAMTPTMRKWFERGGMQTTLQVAEVGDINKLKIFENIYKAKGTAKELPMKIWYGYWQKARLATDFREAILRYAYFIDESEYMSAHDGHPRSFGASNREEIMALHDWDDRAAKLSNEALGAYDSISILGQNLREFLIPFWSWNEINFTRYPRYFRNAVQDGKVTGTIGRKFVGIGLRSPFIAYNIGKFILKALGFSAALYLYNSTFFAQEEKDLPADVQAKPHVILGRGKDGKVRYIDRLGMLSDFLEWFGLDTVRKDAQDYLNGYRSLKEITQGMARSPFNKFIQGVSPLIKTPFELLAKTSFYPDAFKPGHIYDQREYLARQSGLADEYKILTGKPVKNYTDILQNMIMLQSDPGEAAYYDIRDMKQQYMKKVLDKNSGGITSDSDKSEALYNVKMAVRYRDMQAFDRYLMAYGLAGGTEKGLNQSLDSMHPLFGLKGWNGKVKEGDTDEALQFYESLSPEDREKTRTAVKFYEAVLRRRGDEEIITHYSQVVERINQELEKKNGE